MRHDIIGAFSDSATARLIASRTVLYVASDTQPAADRRCRAPANPVSVAPPPAPGARMAAPAPASAADPGTAFKILLSCPDGLPRSRVRTSSPSSPSSPSRLHDPFGCVERRLPPPAVSSIGPPHGGKNDFWLLHPASFACIFLFIMSFPQILNDAFQLWPSDEQ